MTMTYTTLTNEEYNVLNKIADKTKADCWFYIEQDSGGADYIFDLEEGTRLSLEAGIGMLMEAIDCPENYDSCHLTRSEEVILNNLLEKLGLA